MGGMDPLGDIMGTSAGPVGTQRGKERRRKLVKIHFEFYTLYQKPLGQEPVAKHCTFHHCGRGHC